jgi:hypothetical protein
MGCFEELMRLREEVEDARARIECRSKEGEHAEAEP